MFAKKTPRKDRKTVYRAGPDGPAASLLDLSCHLLFDDAFTPRRSFMASRPNVLVTPARWLSSPPSQPPSSPSLPTACRCWLPVVSSTITDLLLTPRHRPGRASQNNALAHCLRALVISWLACSTLVLTATLMLRFSCHYSFAHSLPPSTAISMSPPSVSRFSSISLISSLSKLCTVR